MCPCILIFAQIIIITYYANSGPTTYDEDSIITRAAGDESDEETILDVEKSFSKWSVRSISLFKQLILKSFPLMASLKEVEKNMHGLYEVFLYDTNGEEEVFINQLLIDQGVVASKVPKKKQGKGPCPNFVPIRSEKNRSLCCL